MYIISQVCVLSFIRKIRVIGSCDLCAFSCADRSPNYTMFTTLYLNLCVVLLCGEYVSTEPAASCLPEQWEVVAIGNLAQVVSPSGDVDIMSLRYWQSYDFKLKMDSTRQLIEIENTTVRVTVINDWNKVR